MGEPLSTCTCKIKQIITEMFLGQFYLESYFILSLKNNSCFKNKNGAAMLLPISDTT